MTSFLQDPRSSSFELHHTLVIKTLSVLLSRSSFICLIKFGYSMEKSKLLHTHSSSKLWTDWPCLRRLNGHIFSKERIINLSTIAKTILLSCKNYLTIPSTKLFTVHIPPLSVNIFPQLVIGSSPSLLSSLTIPASNTTSKFDVVLNPG